jgi:hypothetical protein
MDGMGAADVGGAGLLQAFFFPLLSTQMFLFLALSTRS